MNPLSWHRVLRFFFFFLTTAAEVKPGHITCQFGTQVSSERFAVDLVLNIYSAWSREHVYKKGRGNSVKHENEFLKAKQDKAFITQPHFQVQGESPCVAVAITLHSNRTAV